jgi:non-specific serine/threonine protein kinase
MRGALGAELTSFVGRRRLLADLARLLDPGQATCRVLTLTGPGGSGKSRVALQLAAAVTDRYADGVRLVELAPIRDPHLVAPTIAQTVGVRDAGGLIALESLKSYLRDRQLLLVLDNFEQVLGAAGDIPELLAACRRLQVLVTSRAALRVTGECEVAIEPLELPAPPRRSPTGRADALLQNECESVQLFADRAQAVKANFVLTEETAGVVAEICRRLDGLPLAIELAAARSRLLDPPALLSRLEHRLQFLTGGARDLPARQQTLRNTIAWSYDLLDEYEQRLFCGVSVFVGGCSLEALRAVVDSESDILDGMDSLAGKSLVRSLVAPPGEVRIGMLETTREFGLEQLAWRSELDALRLRHARYFLAFAERAEPELWAPAAGTWLERIEAEHDNLRAALEWSLTLGGETGATIALRLTGALARFWWSRGYFGEGLKWLARALTRSPARSAARMKALYGAAWLAHFLHDSVEARALLDESLSIASELADDWSIAWVLHVLGRVAYFDGDHGRARELGLQSLALAEQLDDGWLVGWSLHLLGLAAHICGDYTTADAFYARSLAIRQKLEHREAIGILYQLMGISAHRQTDFARARELYREYLAIGRELGSTFHISNVLAQFGALAAAQGQADRAARLSGAAASFHAASQTVPIPLTVALVTETMERSHTALGEAAFAAAFAEGAAMSTNQAVEEALAVDVALPRTDSLPNIESVVGGPGSAEPVLGSHPSPLQLTSRECEVAVLVARGLTNRQIAAELVITERTVAAHVEHILSKLGFVSRTQVGVWAAANLRGTRSSY